MSAKRDWPYFQIDAIPKAEGQVAFPQNLRVFASLVIKVNV